MTIIYGCAESEKELLKNYPDEVEKIEDSFTKGNFPN